MSCLHPIFLKSIGQNVPCGRCVACLNKRRNDWSFRASKHYDACKTPAYFITLTYDEEHVPWVTLTKERFVETCVSCKKEDRWFNTSAGDKYLDACRWFEENDEITFRAVDYRDLSLFIKRLRKRFGKGISYLSCTEYGPTTYRPHFHMCLFGVDLGSCEDAEKIIKEMWTCGSQVVVSEYNNRRGAYLAKYVTAAAEMPWYLHLRPIKPRLRVSRGFGLSFLTDAMRDWMLADFDHNGLTFDDGYYHVIPKYYVDKVFPCGSEIRAARSVQANRKKEERDVLRFAKLVDYFDGNYLQALDYSRQIDADAERRAKSKIFKHRKL